MKRPVTAKHLSTLTVTKAFVVLQLSRSMPIREVDQRMTRPIEWALVKVRIGKGVVKMTPCPASYKDRAKILKDVCKVNNVLLPRALSAKAAAEAVVDAVIAAVQAAAASSDPDELRATAKETLTRWQSADSAEKKKDAESRIRDVLKDYDMPFDDLKSLWDESQVVRLHAS